LFGSIPKKVDGQGVLLKPGGVQTVVTNIPGIITELRVQPGSYVEKGQSVAVIEERVQAARPKVREEIFSPYAGRVVELMANPGSAVGPGTALFVVEPQTEALEAVAYIPAGGNGKRVRVGMPAQVSPAAFKREEYGYLVGEVIAVSDSAVSREGMMRLLGNDVVVDGLLKAGPVLAVTVALKTDPNSRTGLRWSSSGGPTVRLSSGMMCSAQLIIERRRPISLVIPKLRELSGVQ
jgi:HlyD family secretion protein